jgi:hypothetical protein
MTSTLSILLAALCLTLSNVVVSAGDTVIPLRERWSISRPQTQGVVFEENDGSFVTSLRYEISSFIQDASQIQVQAVPGKDCQFPSNEKGRLDVSVSLDEAEFASDDETSNFVSVKVTGSEREFCTRFSLHSEKNQQLVNWLDAEVTVHVTEDEQEQTQRAKVDLTYKMKDGGEVIQEIVQE